MRRGVAPCRWFRPPEGEATQVIATLEQEIRLGRAPFWLVMLPESRSSLPQKEVRAELCRRLVGEYQLASWEAERGEGLMARLDRMAQEASELPKLVFCSGFEALPESSFSTAVQQLNLAREALASRGARLVFLLSRALYPDFVAHAADLAAWAPPPLIFPGRPGSPSKPAQLSFTDLLGQLTTLYDLSARVLDKELTSSRAVLANDLARRLLALDLKDIAQIVLEKLQRFHGADVQTGRQERLYLDYVADHYQRLDIFSITEDAPVTLELNRPYVRLKIERAPDRLAEKYANRPESERRSRHGPPPFAELSRDWDVDSAVAAYPRLVILGAPGSGKTTLLKYLALSGAQSNKPSPAQKLPVFVSAVTLARNWAAAPEATAHTLPELLGQIFAKQAPWLALKASFFQQLLGKGRALLLIDGLDEVAQAEMRQRLATLIQQAGDLWPQCQWVLSSRPHGFQAIAPQGLMSFVQAETQNLTNTDLADFVHSWYRAVESATKGGASDVQDQARLAAERLISAIQAAPGVRELAGNPLLLGVLALVHRRNVTLPQRRTELYDECTQQLLGFWDQVQSREVCQTELNRDEKRFLLQPLARWFHERGRQGLGADRAAVEDKLGTLFVQLFGDDQTTAQTRAQAFLRDIQERAGLLVEREDGLFAFSHLTFQEYLTARALAEEEEDEQTRQILAHLHDPWWREVSLLLAGHLADVRHLGQRGRRMAIRLIRAVYQAQSSYEDLLQRDLLLAGRMACDLGKLGVAEQDRAWLQELMLEIHAAWAQSPFDQVIDEAKNIQALAPEWAIGEALREKWRAMDAANPRQQALLQKLLAFRKADDLFAHLVQVASKKKFDGPSDQLWRLLVESDRQNAQLLELARKQLKRVSLWNNILSLRILWHHHQWQEVVDWLEYKWPAREEYWSWSLGRLLARFSETEAGDQVLEPFLQRWLAKGGEFSAAVFVALDERKPRPLSQPLLKAIRSAIEQDSLQDYPSRFWTVLQGEPDETLLVEAVRNFLQQPRSEESYFRLAASLAEISARIPAALSEELSTTTFSVLSRSSLWYDIDTHKVIQFWQAQAVQGETWALKKLQQLADADQEKEQWFVAALHTLAQLGDGGARSELEQFAGVKPAWRQAEAVEALGEIDCNDFTAELPNWCRHALRDRAVTVRAACIPYLAKRLEERDDSDALAALLNLAQHPAPSCWQSAWRHLLALSSKATLDAWWREHFARRHLPQSKRWQNWNAAVALTVRFAEQPADIQAELADYWGEWCRHPETITPRWTPSIYHPLFWKFQSNTALAYDMLRRVAEHRQRQAGQGNGI